MSMQRTISSDDDILVSVQYCGVCHSDVHQARNEWHNTVWPCVPGHEIVGTVAEIGSQVKEFAIGDRVGIGCMINSCGKCASCAKGEEQYCLHGFLATYNGPSKPNGTNTFGGYSDCIVANKKFLLRIPSGIDSAKAAPLMCAGVTTYSPLKHWGIGSQHNIAIVGIGGLGHLAIQIARAMGAKVTAITTDPEKKPDLEHLGAQEVVNSLDGEAMKGKVGSFDYILSTIPTTHDVNPYLQLLKHDGVMTIVGCLQPLEPPVQGMLLAASRLSLTGSMIGSIAETQEMLDFCVKHKVEPKIQIIATDAINHAFDQMVANDVRYRYVIDMKSLKK